MRFSSPMLAVSSTFKIIGLPKVLCLANEAQNPCLYVVTTAPYDSQLKLPT